MGERDWRYRAGGKGERTILWLHGALGNSAQMRRFVQPLEETVRFVAPTLPAVASIESTVAGLDELLDEEDVGRVAVAGGSFGGMVAQCYAARRPERVDGLILFDTVAPSAASRARLQRKMAWLRFLPWSPLRWVVGRALQRLLRTERPLSPEQRIQLEHGIDRFKQSLRAYDKASLVAHVSLSTEFFGLAHAELWRGPTLIIRSSDDPGSANRPDLAATYPGARLLEFEDAGHLGSLLHTDAYVAAVQRFVETLYESQ